MSIQRRLLRAVPLMLVGLFLVFYFLRTETFYKLQTSYIDSLMQVDVPAEPSPVAIVEITQGDFETLFEHDSRPLNVGKLRKLIDDVSRGRPCVIGVDVDTGFSQFSELTVDPHWAPVIWARGIEELPPDISVRPRATDVLGGQAEYNVDSGLPLLIDDSDGVTRFYARSIEVEDESGICRLPAFFWAVYRKAMEEKRSGRKCPEIPIPSEGEIYEMNEMQNDGQELYIRFARENSTDPSGGGGQLVGANGRLKIPASHISEFSKMPGWENNPLINGKIVLIGGTYLGEDIHETPVGRMAGVEIMANAVETEVSGGGIPQPGFFTMALLSVFDGLLLIGLFQLLPMRLALPASLVAIVILSFVCSFLTFYSFSYWGLFALVMGGVLAAELMDYARDLVKGSYKRLLADIRGQEAGKGA